MMDDCHIEGTSDMYGLGIRLGYYLQWYSSILAIFLAPSEVPNLRFMTELFIAATFLATVILTIEDVNRLKFVEKYIILLQIFGTYLGFVPLYLLEYAVRQASSAASTRVLNLGLRAARPSLPLFMGAAVYWGWLWVREGKDHSPRKCPEYVFLMARIQFDHEASYFINCTIVLILGPICMALALETVRRICRNKAATENLFESLTKAELARIRRLWNLHGVVKLAIAVIVTIAIELTIFWNKIEGVNTLSGAGQTIPFVTGVGALVRVLYVHFFRRPFGSSVEDDSARLYGESEANAWQQLSGAQFYHHPNRPLESGCVDA
ncbi:hypothetical protein M011DRAFT_470546 [Sporormia fimetaria CBS 119925]|uniref:Uncharacterized protein n=1 Tax=Sporormia fimetaria CBS 119925 TaxID=1340428 RepID=A0A6A6V1L0_9PLEO|nr:hypothetical protein M011DRAFT_470546 [Sporormia fimetaria CBS 119925]